ncbi:MAG: hypothetical protein AMXMBFR58_23990 [Phycisphaerae bacterium]|nr:hypothetical protein [Phycisphaerales bacterium]MCK6478206.1 hypothetical protein [Phycisphaerales bacterium]
MNSSAFDPAAPVEFRPQYGVLAFLFPGLGHVAQGQFKRGVLISIGLIGLFFGGLLVGGIDVVDKREDRLWFLAQGMFGPLAFGVDYVHQNHFKVLDRGDAAQRIGPSIRTAVPGEVRDPAAGFFQVAPPKKAAVDPATGEVEPPPNIKSLAKVNELGTLFCAVAGMMNLIVIIDAAFPRARRRAEGA